MPVSRVFMGPGENLFHVEALQYAVEESFRGEIVAFDKAIGTAVFNEGIRPADAEDICAALFANQEFFHC